MFEASLNEIAAFDAAHGDELDGFNEIVQSLEQLMQQYKQQAGGDVVNHSELVR